MAVSTARRQDLVISWWISLLMLGCISAAVVAFGGFSVVTAGIAKIVLFILVHFVAVLAIVLLVHRRSVGYRH